MKTRNQVGVLGWGLGLSVFFSDYFSPLFVGPVMRDLTDRYRISREKLAYICDSTSASVIVLIPISGWAVYLIDLVGSYPELRVELEPPPPTWLLASTRAPFYRAS